MYHMALVCNFSVRCTAIPLRISVQLSSHQQKHKNLQTFGCLLFLVFCFKHQSLCTSSSYCPYLTSLIKTRGWYIGIIFSFWSRGGLMWAGDIYKKMPLNTLSFCYFLKNIGWDFQKNEKSEVHFIVKTYKLLIA